MAAGVAGAVAQHPSTTTSRSKPPAIHPSVTDRPLPPLGAWTALALVLALTAVRLVVNAWLDPLPLSGDEAQYWIYGQHLAGGYYSKPPLLPLLMRGATDLFGQHAWAMRLPSVLLHLGIAGLLWWLGRLVFAPGVGALAAVLWLTLPAVTVSSMLASTDPPMLFGWALATVALVKALRSDGAAWGWWALVGVGVGLGLLGKYTMIAWVPAAAALVALDPAWRPGRRWRGLLLAVASAVLTFAPNLVWNARHGFPTLAHLGENADLGTAAAQPLAARAGALGEFLLGQIGVFGPIAAVVLVGLLVRRSTWRDPGLRLCLVLGLPLLLVIALQAWLNRANDNWAAPAYLGFTLAVAAVLVAAGRQRLTRWLVGLNLGVLAAVVLVAVVTRPEPAPWSRLWDPFRLLRGMERVADEVGPLLRAEPDRYLVMGNRMQLAAVLERTGWPLERTVAWNPDRRVSHHFEMVTAWPDDPDARFLLVALRGEGPAMAQDFDRAEPVVAATVATHADRALDFVVYRAEGRRTRP